MNKKKLGPQPILWPHPVVLVGSLVDGKPDFAAVAWTGVAASNPPSITVALQHHRYSLKGIRENMSFSVNIPSIDLIKETDYCGLVSGSNTDKVKDCGFNVFYGNLSRAPLIEQCPVNMECEVSHILNLGSHALVVGKVIESHVSKNCLADDNPDINKVRPFAFIAGKYHTIGKEAAQAFSVGKEIKKKN